jgi:DNA-binding GntR family transcriptional regulator
LIVDKYQLTEACAHAPSSPAGGAAGAGDQPKGNLMSPKGAGRADSALRPPDRRSLGDDVADQLREAILHGDLTAGQHLREEELARRLDVSRGPVRDAFVFLERDGLVRSARHKGVTVVELTRRDLHEVYTLRSALEPLAVDLVIDRRSPPALAGIEAALGEFTAEVPDGITAHRAAQLDVQFHDAIYRAARHERLYDAWSRLRMPAYWFMLSRNVTSPQWRAETVSGHTQIFDMLRAGDRDGARDAVSEHIQAGFARIEASHLGAISSERRDLDAAV